MFRIAIDLLGKAWNLPNTLLALAYAVPGHVLGWLLGTRPRVDLGNNAIQFHNNALMLTAMAVGNVIIYGPGRSPGMPNTPFLDTPCGHTVGREEYRHTQQGQVLGLLYLPAHLVAGIISLLRAPHPELTCRTDVWHQNNFMERGPMRDRIFW